MGLPVISDSSELCDWLIHGRSRKLSSFRVNLALVTAPDSIPSQLLPSLAVDVMGMSPCALYTCETQKQILKANQRCFHQF